MNEDITNEGLIKRHLFEKYGLEVNSINSGPRGFVAETYIADKNGKKYFIKMVKKGRYDNNLVQSVNVQHQLCELGMQNIPCLLLSTSGQTSTNLDNYTFILFNYIEGKWTFDYKDKELLNIIVYLHKIDPKEIKKIKLEDFELPYRIKLQNMLQKVYSFKGKDGVRLKTSSYLENYRTEIERDLQNFKRLINECKGADFDFRITHEDPWGNVMRTEEGKLILFDWDDIKIAPVERDLWFKINELEVLRYYQRSFSEYKINKLAYDYYLYNRYFYDLYGFLVEIYSEKPDEHKEENYNLLLKDWNNWLRTEVRKHIKKY